MLVKHKCSCTVTVKQTKKNSCVLTIIFPSGETKDYGLAKGNSLELPYIFEVSLPTGTVPSPLHNISLDFLP